MFDIAILREEGLRDGSGVRTYGGLLSCLLIPTLLSIQVRIL